LATRIFISELTGHKVASNEEAKELITETRDRIANIVQEFESREEEQKGSLVTHYNAL
jgi:hypothetical protein